MMKPEVEAVRFAGGIDVIATSARPAPMTLTPISDGSYYTTRGEAMQANLSYTDVNDWYRVDIESGHAIKSQGGPWLILEKNYNYAWYNKNDTNWYTLNKKYGDIASSAWPVGYNDYNG